jgi:hypothetical protein
MYARMQSLGRFLGGFVLLATACGASTTNEKTNPPDASAGDVVTQSIPDASPDVALAVDAAKPKVDADGDGLDDADESAWADEYFPFYAIDPNDGCKTHGVLYRVSPHPADATKLAIVYDMLYDADCGASGHDGDDEVFSVLADPKKKGVSGILAVRAISHQGTPCEHDTTCGVCQGMSACGTSQRNGVAYPVVYASKDKHGNYADKSTCDTSFICDFGGCGLPSVADAPPFVNAGEPGKPLVSNLTTQGFITTTNGWTHQELFDFDPWKPGTFGGAGDVSQDLVDTSFVIAPTGCP